MTTLLYQKDSTQQSCTAVVTAVDSALNAVAMDQTCFYPGGGGQPCDSGMLLFQGASVPVIKVKKVGDEVWHFIQPDSPLPEIGISLTGQLDWEKRYQLMRTHSAMHVLCGVIFNKYGASVTGGDMEPLKGRMDFEFESMQKELVTEIEDAVNVEVLKAHPIRTAILPRDEAFKIPDLIRTKINLLPEGIPHVRIVEIIGLDLQADGGTHVQNTSEIGKIRVVDYKSKGKINKRIYVELD